ncbi:LytTR family transcriptional regulator [Bacillus cereus ATCC 10876]|uniref:LytTR family DNA-binding domain-containing protein n=1 Tax=Bacillus TaxID=1386 RepID=UPI00019FF80F|nr:MULTISPECIES: LytTR family DNA-binding domain-containing protein [Bacillus]MDJ0281910.1 LytTR family DNA-binding domain-containing protein [Bacillus bombysepticus]EEK48371.1 Response regulator receiver protein [Bacillus cereus ATCC 10876]KFL63935.1 lytTr DNA-binding domain protein [Bacillus cereus ATCC 10876]MBO1131898.1 LytTR family transcriptional regulator [Bacillus cereus]MDJ0295815.1 LytTR family DNA-binding domain-containing protein [Bacillus bombysepticus]
MKVNINIIEKLKEESCTFYVHKVTSFIQDMVSTLENSSDDYLIVNSIHKNEQEKISCSTIYYLEYLERKVFIYTKENIFEVKSPLYKLQYTLPDNFIRISKATIVNIHFLNKFSAKTSGNLEALLSNGENLIVSRKYVSSLKNKLKQYSK